MVRVVSTHSFRGGTGKSNLTANLAVQLAQAGERVGVVDTDIQSPGIHVLFGLRGVDVRGALNDHLFNSRPIGDIAHDVTPDGVAGTIHLVPSSVRPGEISRVLREGYDAQRLVLGLRSLVDELGLDTLLIDTHPGLGEETLLALVVSDTVLMVLRPDQQDYEGTGVVAEVTDGLGVPRRALVVNKVPPTFEPQTVRRRVEEAYGTAVVGLLLHDDLMMTLASGGLFVLRYPDHPLTTAISEITAYLQNGDG
jgi:MinD-like ATPase involved in chromosome partitioning or flagellar assembly